MHDSQTCCGPNRWVAQQCVEARLVYIEGKEAFCVGDLSLHDAGTVHTFEVPPTVPLLFAFTSGGLEFLPT